MKLVMLFCFLFWFVLQVLSQISEFPVKVAAASSVGLKPSAEKPGCEPSAALRRQKCPFRGFMWPSTQNLLESRRLPGNFSLKISMDSAPPPSGSKSVSLKPSVLTGALCLCAGLLTFADAARGRGGGSHEGLFESSQLARRGSSHGAVQRAQAAAATARALAM